MDGNQKHVEDGRVEVIPGEYSFRLRDALSGTFAGIACVYTGLPLDVVKVRLQAGTSTSAAFVIFLFPTEDDITFRLYRGPLDCFVQTFRREGFRALYKGATAAVSSALIENTGEVKLQSTHFLTPRFSCICGQRVLGSIFGVLEV